MDKQTKINNIQFTLEDQLNAYKALISILVAFTFLIILLYVVNPNGFTKFLGYETFITVPILIFIAYFFREFLLFQNNPSESGLSKMPFSDKEWFPNILIALMVLLGIGAFFSILAVGGVFSNSPPENNIAMIMNFTIILTFAIVSFYIYSKSKEKDNKILEKMPKVFNEINELRTKFTVVFFAFIFIVVLLYLLNPGDVMTTYGGPTIFFTLFTGMVLVGMITIYQYYLSNPSKIGSFSSSPTFLSFFKGLYITLSLVLSGLLIYTLLKSMGIFNQSATDSNTIGSTIFNLFLLCTMLAIIYKLANAGGFLDKNPLYRLIVNTLLYIPCLLVIFMNNLLQLLGIVKPPGTEYSTFRPPSSFEIKMLVLSLVLIIGYFGTTLFIGPYLKSKYYKQGGKQLINEPIPIDIQTNVASYQTLSGTDKPNYQYAISFWVYLDSFSPSTNSSYLKIVPILSYGDNPCIKYDAPNNTLLITVKQDNELKEAVDYIQGQEENIKLETINEWNNIQEKIHDTIEKVKTMPISVETDSDGHRLIYKQPDVLLQKWNHIVINYNGGTLDVFYNGKLVKSAIEVVPYQKLDMLTVGTEGGVSGDIANLVYFNKPLDIITIHTLYSSFKDKNPPSI